MENVFIHKGQNALQLDLSDWSPFLMLLPNQHSANLFRKEVQPFLFSTMARAHTHTHTISKSSHYFRRFGFNLCGGFFRSIVLWVEERAHGPPKYVALVGPKCTSCHSIPSCTIQMDASVWKPHKSSPDTFQLWAPALGSRLGSAPSMPSGCPEF